MFSLCARLLGLSTASGNPQQKNAQIAALEESLREKDTEIVGLNKIIDRLELVTSQAEQTKNAFKQKDDSRYLEIAHKTAELDNRQYRIQDLEDRVIKAGKARDAIDDTLDKYNNLKVADLEKILQIASTIEGEGKAKEAQWQDHVAKIQQEKDDLMRKQQEDAVKNRPPAR
jgi:hypothetical protein